jgi:hypothetical protein
VTKTARAAQAATTETTETTETAQARTYVVQWELKRNGQRLQSGDEIDLTDDELQALGLGGSAVLQLKA